VTPAPEPWCCLDPSKCMTHVSGSGSKLMSGASVQSATKSAKTWDLIAVLAL
jgi:hypothetical protein